MLPKTMKTCQFGLSKTDLIKLNRLRGPQADTTL